MAVTRDGPVPYAPPSAMLEVIDGYRNRGLQTPFSGDVLARAGVSDSLLPRVTQTLEILDLIDEQGNPTEVFEGLRTAPETEYRQRMSDWLRGTYAEVFSFTDPATDPADKIRDAFRTYEPRGQQARMVTLFLGLCKAAGIVPEGQEKPRQREPRQKPQVQVRRKPKPQQGAPGGASIPQALGGLLATLPKSGQWTKAQRDDFSKTFQAVLDYSIKIKEDQAEADEPEGE